MTWVVVVYGPDSDAEAGQMDTAKAAHGPFPDRESAEAFGAAQWHTDEGGEWDPVELIEPPHAIDCDMDADCGCRS